ncbi:hypothetical protein [Reichenbachiella sp.]|uniref:hypothetical protein n=1 Tax=Reichenbachiella sp. TaxID=2184521 RepID=UPI0032978915
MNSIHKYLKTSASKVGMSLLIVLTSLAVSAQSITESALIWDASEGSNTRTLDADKTLRHLITDLKLEEDTKMGVKYLTAICGENEIPAVRVASLPKVVSMFPSISERNREIGKFLKKAKSDINYLASVPCDQQQTNLHRTIVQVTKQYAPEAEEKKLKIVSDLVEVSSIINMNRYKNNPSGLLTDFDTIVQAFENDAPLPDLSGVEVILSTRGNTNYLLFVSRFWERYLMSKNARVITVGNIR